MAKYKEKGALWGDLMFALIVIAAIGWACNKYLIPHGNPPLVAPKVDSTTVTK